MQVNNTLLHTAAILEEAADLEVSNTGAKVAIVPVGQEHPEGYQTLELISERANIDQFADNECVEILANVLDFLSYENINQFVLIIIPLHHHNIFYFLVPFLKIYLYLT